MSCFSFKSKDMKKQVVQLCRLHNLTMRQGKKGIKLYKNGALVGCVHQTLSDYRALDNFIHEVTRHIKEKEI